MRRAILLLALATPASAHEIGTTQVNATFLRDRTYRIELVTAPQSLLNKLEAQARLPRSPRFSLPALQALAPELAKHVEVTFLRRPERSRGIGAALSRADAPGMTPRIDITATEYAAKVILTGEIPPRATHFTWRYDLTYSSYALALQNEGAAPSTQWLDADTRSAPFALAGDAPRARIAWQYLKLGFTHILPHGLDHILFVLGLFLLTTRIKPLLMQITAFTVAHTITLGLTIYGLVSLPARVVETAIAVSIVFIAVENLTTTELRPWRTALVFAFGLLHGMGFAGVLRELGLPRGESATALISFNAGVELGQLAVVAGALAVVSRWRRAASYRRWLVVPASALIAVAGLVWTVERAVA